MSNQEKIDQYLNYRLSASEIEENQFPKDLQHIVDTVATFEPPKSISNDEAWSKISQQIEKSAEGKGRVVPFKRLAIYGAAIAATLVILIGIIGFLRPKEITISASEDEQLSFYLPDGSNAILLPNASLSYMSSPLGSNRAVTLDGEAYFYVIPGNPFSIETAEGNVNVLGTTFKVKAASDVFEVSCYSGKVSVSAPDIDGTMVLEKGQGVMKTSEVAFSPFEVFVEQENQEDGLIIFEKVQLNQVVLKLQEQFSVRIKVPSDILNRKFDIYYPPDDLTEALSIISKTTGLTYQYINDRYIELNH